MLNVNTGQNTEIIDTSYQNIDTLLLKLKNYLCFKYQFEPKSFHPKRARVPNINDT